MSRAGVGSSATVSLATAVVGPMENGRGYTLLRHSAGDRAARAWDGMLRHFSLALGAWADRRAEPFVAMFALDEAALNLAVARVCFLGDADLGTVAMANVLIVPRETLEALDWRSHLLLALIPWPDDGEDLGFADAPVAVDLRALVGSHAAPPREVDQGTASFGLEWRDQTLDAGTADLEALLAAALDGLDPPEQRSRIDGWVTTDALARSGAFDPASAFRLVIRASGAPRPRQIATQAPPVWRAWRIVEQAARAVGADAGMAWKPLYAERAPAGVAAIAVLEACVALDAVARSALLAQVAERAEAEGAIASVVYEALALALARLMEQPGTAEGAAYYLNAFVEANADRPGAIASVVSLATGPGILGWMSEQSLDLLLYQGLADHLGAFAGERESELVTLSPDARLRLLKAASAPPIAAARQPVLARLIAQGLDEPGLRKAAEAALSRVLQATDATALPGLATGQAWSVASPDRDLRKAFAERVLSPVIRGSMPASRMAYVEALGLALAAVAEPAARPPAAVRGQR
ncbi:hypothetical protein BH10PSE2_BH10PSE2_24530 [soil metagenome]